MGQIIGMLKPFVKVLLDDNCVVIFCNYHRRSDVVYRLLFILFMILPSSYASTADLAGACDDKSNDGVIILDSSKIRMNNREECFSKEHIIIEKSRKSHPSVKAHNNTALQQVVGLGLSGGGIKSSAFQLGLLSGLHRSRNTNGSPLLNEIDYISSVSGGSWANGAYISAPESDEKFFNCLSEIATDKPTPECKKSENLLPDQQNKIKGSGDWKKQIIDNYLRGGDITFKSLREQMDTHSSRPFPIFLATHSNTIIETKNPENFPFEFTPISIGAIADCNSPETPCGILRRLARPLHWNNSPKKGFVIDTTKENGVSMEVKKYRLYKKDKELYLSHAMWASGALIAKAFSMHLHLRKNEEDISGVRNKYVLSDGGKTDNLGLIPLVERGADFIILSQIASDAKLGFGDLKRSSAQVERLFGLDVDTERLIQPHASDVNDTPIITLSCVKDNGNNVSSILLIKPTTRNIAGFYKFLEESKYAELLEFLNDQEMDSDKPMRFPQNDTISLKYPKKLVYSYYALGEYIGETKLSKALNLWLNNGTQCI